MAMCSYILREREDKQRLKVHTGVFTHHEKITLQEYFMIRSVCSVLFLFGGPPDLYWNAQKHRHPS